MNREQRRNKNYIELKIDKARQEGINQGRLEALHLIMTMVAYTIDYKLELKDGDLAELINSIMFNIDAFRTHHLDRNDLQIIKKELAEKGVIID